ncbi:BMC domain-containing protein [Halanaerobium hydrogeniformans]|uniref:Microcompartments protein n=1 Tax=Halanaerobium hydrogeniformans TaxID=656519 RepID=E4RMA2_HALHG|nr:BMC domain-containing protein [Halanaerobium hydrogeniformans]ADQ14433.1 microcompartments protein [Halanaerobium hydrogeniformans]
MSRTAIGLVETRGLLPAYEAVDVAAKSANVELIGYEISRGGMIIIKISGDIGAVKSAIDAAKTAASKLGKVYSAHVIPRPAKDIHEKLIYTDDTVGYQKDDVDDQSTVEEIDQEKTEDQAVEEVVEETEAEETSSEEEAETVESEEEEELEDSEDEEICNICEDPNCPRTKGDLRTDCIHYDEIIGDDE